jgi:molybdopterin molybdotransferase
MKPGKPFLFATGQWMGEPKWVFGLPGNPVSAFVTFRVLVSPVLERIRGLHTAEKESAVRVGEAISNDGDRPHYVRGRVEHGVFWPQGLQRSDALFGLSQSTALLRVEVGEHVLAGEMRTILR